jgi:hypothetical protein
MLELQSILAAMPGVIVANARKKKRRRRRKCQSLPARLRFCPCLASTNVVNNGNMSVIRAPVPPSDRRTADYVDRHKTAFVGECGKNVVAEAMLSLARLLAIADENRMIADCVSPRSTSDWPSFKQCSSDTMSSSMLTQFRAGALLFSSTVLVVVGSRISKPDIVAIGALTRCLEAMKRNNNTDDTILQARRCQLIGALWSFPNIRKKVVDEGGLKAVIKAMDTQKEKGTCPTLGVVCSRRIARSRIIHVGQDSCRCW